LSSNAHVLTGCFKKCAVNAKACEAGATFFRQGAAVRSAGLKSLDRLRPAIKREWANLLGQEPAVSALANPDTLALLMDHTLDQLRLGLRQPGENGCDSRSRSPGQRALAAGAASTR
jgi:hypothetical protein